MDEPTPTYAATRSGDAPEPPPPRVALARGDAVGRYLVIDRVGSGAMGVVYSAYDPELDRRVALKLLHHARNGGSSSGDAVRLRREAQSLAKLSHPAVVGVYDVGATGDQIFIAMEFVEGTTLTRWRALAPRGFREVVAVMREAGRGLAAAHAAGLLHRDFKPDNVMVDRDGRVRVMDFGLARVTGAPPPSAPAAPMAEISGAIAATHEAGLVGTPAYMAPEQLAGAELDARADQFAFAVTLWELLYGTRPFRGQSLAELATNVIEGRLTAVPRGITVPLQLRKVVLRGLSASADDRFPSMAAMVAALDRDPTRLRRRLVAAGGLVVVAGGTIAWQRVQQARAVAACEATGAEIDEIWGEPAHVSLRDTVMTHGGDRGAAMWERLEPRLDAYAEQWREARVAACRASEIDDARSDDLTARAEACLDERRNAFASLVGALAQADAAGVQLAARTASLLARVDPCTDEQWLATAARPPEDPETRTRVAAVHRQLADAVAASLLNAYARGRALAVDALDQARVIGWAPAIAHAELRLGIIEGYMGDHTAQAATLEAAYLHAGAVGSDEVAIEAAIALTSCEGNELAHPEVGLAWARHADMLLERMHEPTDSLRRANLAGARGSVYEAIGKHDDALRETLMALEGRQRWLGEEHPLVAATLGAIGLIYYGRADYGTSVTFQTQSLELRERALGPVDSSLAVPLNNLALAEISLGSLEPARQHLEHSLAIVEADLGPDHPNVASALNNIGVVMRSTGDFAGAYPKFERAAAIWRKALGPTHPDVAIALDNLGICERELGRYDAAMGHHREALEIRERSLGRDDPETATSLGSIAEVELARGHAAEAIAPLERALVITETKQSDLHVRASMRFALARALWDSDTDKSRATLLATKAGAEMREAGEVAKSELVEVERWLQTHEGEAQRKTDAR